MSTFAERPFPRFRDDLAIREKDAGNSRKVFSVYDPISGERFEFDEHTFFLCESFDGYASPEQIAQNFSQRFGRSITIENLLQVFDELLAIGLLSMADAASVAAFRGETAASRAQPLARGASGEVTEVRDRDDDGEDAREYRWPLFDPGAIYDVLVSAVRPIRLLFLLAVYSLVVALPVALFIFFDNDLQISQDLARLRDARSYLGRLIFSLFTLNLLRCVIQGTVISWYGGRVKTFGIRLRFGIIPRFYIDKSAIRHFERRAKLWSYGSNLLFRMVVIVLGVFTWYFTRGSGSQLAIYAIILTQAALITLILLSLPLRAADGYRWMVTYFRLPPNLIKMAVMVLISTFTGKQLPTSISPTFKRRLFVYGFALILFWTYAFFRITSHIAGGLTESFPLLFGEATEVIMTTLVVLLIARWGLMKFGRVSGGGTVTAKAGGGSRSVPAVTGLGDLDLVSSSGAPSVSVGESPWISRGVQLLAVGLVVVFLSLPYPFRPGGVVTLLPPEQQAIQAPVSGKVSEVLQPGGDGQPLAKGTLIATMTSSTLETAIATLQEQVAGQEAVVEKQRAILDSLLAGARKEEIDQARAQAEQAAHEVTLAERELETARVTWRFSAQELERIDKLPVGVISELEVSRSEKQAEVDRMRISEFESNLAARKKNAEESDAALALLLSGASKQEIEVARQELAVAEAELRELHAELAHAQSQASSGRLTIPFDGYLEDAYLNQKLGSYLNVGETYATAQTHRKPLVELLLPEYEVGEMSLGGEAEVRLMSFPDEPFRGRVVTIEPSGQPADFGQVFKVVIELDDIEHPVRPGMTGYAKVLLGEKPLFVIISRPVVRFFQVEAWSWMP
jgi:putative peptide zinc metalloprotease protein